jgi:hypothetical protein
MGVHTDELRAAWRDRMLSWIERPKALDADPHAADFFFMHRMGPWLIFCRVVGGGGRRPFPAEAARAWMIAAHVDSQQVRRHAVDAETSSAFDWLDELASTIGWDDAGASDVLPWPAPAERRAFALSLDLATQSLSGSVDLGHLFAATVSVLNEEGLLVEIFGRRGRHLRASLGRQFKPRTPADILQVRADVKVSGEATAVLDRARALAARRRDTVVTPLHVLRELVRQPAITALLAEAGISPSAVAARVDINLGR